MVLNPKEQSQNKNQEIPVDSTPVETAANEVDQIVSAVLSGFLDDAQKAKLTQAGIETVKKSVENFFLQSQSQTLVQGLAASVTGTMNDWGYVDVLINQPNQPDQVEFLEALKQFRTSYDAQDEFFLPKAVIVACIALRYNNL
jgi:hypothetical protein